MKIKLTLLLLSFYNFLLCNDQDLVAWRQLVISEVVSFLKTDKKASKDELLQAIISNDVKKVEELTKNLDLSCCDGVIEANVFQSWVNLKKSDLQKFEKIVNSFNLSKVDKICIGHSYLSFSILLSVSFVNKEEKENNLKIIDLLLSKGANPHCKIGRAYFVEGADYISYYTVFKEALEFGCDMEIFRLLKKHGLKADYVLPADFATDTKSLRQVAKEINNQELLSILE